MVKEERKRVIVLAKRRIYDTKGDIFRFFVYVQTPLGNLKEKSDCVIPRGSYGYQGGIPWIYAYSKGYN